VIHIQPTAALAERVLLPGDPGRAMRLAQELILEPKMFNHHRGLWGYSGTALDGEPLSVQSTGMGGPSTAIVVHELIELGARRLLRTGTCGSLVPGLGLGDLVIATMALGYDGTSRALGAGEQTPASQGLVAALCRADGDATSGTVVTTDLFYDPRHPEHEWITAGAIAVDMESSVLFTLAQQRDLEAGTLLVVSDTVIGEPARIDADALLKAELRMGQVALRALGTN
jgi:uridine phosphorylase